MPYAPKRPCRQPGCAELVGREDKGFCPAHRRERQRRQDERRGSSAARGYGGKWPALREMVLRREPRCVLCLAAGLLTLAEEVDHIVPKSRGGTDELGNLQGLCGPHHKRKTALEDGGFGRVRAERGARG